MEGWQNVPWTPNCNSSCCTFELTNLSSNTEYTLEVLAETLWVKELYSNEIRALSGQTTPPAPAKVTVVGVDSSSVEVEWTAVSYTHLTLPTKLEV